jgi:hypothetical protein
VRENGVVKHSFLLFVCKVSLLDGVVSDGAEGDVAWFDLNKVLEEKLIPSDRWFIKNLVSKKTPLFFSSVADDGREYVFEARKY